MESIKVDSTHRITIDLLDEKWGKTSWQAFARFMRKDLKGKASDIYKRSLFYKHEVTSGPQPPEGRVRDDYPFPLKRLTSYKK
jgi:hypothetical protein